MENASTPDVTAFILAGGRSARMGADKAFLNFDGRTLLARALSLARSVTPNVCIVGSEGKFAQFAPVVEDVFQGRGPLGGIHAALRASPMDLNLMLAVDAPLLSIAFLQYLIGKARSAPHAAVTVPRCGGHRQPLSAIYRREFAEAAENALLAGRNRIDLLFGVVKTQVIEEDELERAGFSAAIFCNLNTPEEVQAIQRRADFDR